MMTEEELDFVRESARNGNASGEFELATLYMSDYFKFRAVYTLRAIYKGVLRIYDAIVANLSLDIRGYIREYYEAFKSSPSSDALNSLLVASIKHLTQVSPISMPIFTSGLTDGICSLSEALPQILDRHYPEWHKTGNISEKTAILKKTPTIDSLYLLLEEIAKTASYKVDGNLIDKLLADAVFKGENRALNTLAGRKGYKTAGVKLAGNCVVAEMSSTDNYSYPSITLGTTAETINVSKDKKMVMRTMIDFFTHDVSVFNHYLSVVYNLNSKQSRDAGYSLLQTLTASVMTWIGPKKFTLDVIDYEHTGIGAYPAQFLPEKQVKIISRDTDWEAELSTLESLIEKRSRQMQSIMDYNRSNPDMIEPFKIVVVQDYEGKLITTQRPIGEHPDQKEKDRYEREQLNVRRFLHLLERGYRYGIIFITGSGKGVYKSSLPTVDCTQPILTYPTEPYNATFVEGVNFNEKDWLMRWLAGGEELERKRTKTQAGDQMDGSAGLLVTEVADDGVDIEFRLDTVSHTHAFVIGKTGSGKSVLLHNIITGLVTAYGPDDLELYLLDLKMGGVEFNRYRRLPHLRSLLVDNSDIQIVLEIMRDIDVMMRERGKEFRDAGVSNVKEYNIAHPEKKMSQVIVVIDECHAIFSMGSGRGALKDQREITERLVKIAKEGRSQGIHLIFATQTLSGSEIPPDIQKNITDYYLLKCAPSDSESLVRGSSAKTESLPVGKVYYYHADRQALFQGTYKDSQACDELIAESLSRYSNSHSHGQFYFNGAQIFSLTPDVIKSLSETDRKGLHGSPGRMINLQQTPVDITLKSDYSENVVLTGINTEEQLSRTTLALMTSQIVCARQRGEDLKVNVINCLDIDSRTSSVLAEMADNGLVTLYNGAESEQLLKRLCDNVAQKSMGVPTLLYIYGQDRFSELKRDQKFIEDRSEIEQSNDTFDIFQGISFSTDQAIGTAHNCDSFRKALIYLLENGPLAGLNTLVQLDKPDKLLFDDFISAKIVSSRFKHIVILRSEARAAMSLGLSDDIMVENLSADLERLRAFYYCDDDSSTRLFSPYEFISSNVLKSLL